jgi:hypothetical protein
MKNDKPDFGKDIEFAANMLNTVVEAVGEKAPGVRTVATVANMLGVAIWFSAKPALQHLAIVATMEIAKCTTDALQKGMGRPRDAAQAAEQVKDMLDRIKNEVSPHSPRG